MARAGKTAKKALEAGVQKKIKGILKSEWHRTPYK